MEKKYPLLHTFSENFNQLKYPQVYARYELTMLTLLTSRKKAYSVFQLYRQAETAFSKILDNDTAPLFYMNDYLGTLCMVNGEDCKFYAMLFLMEIIKEAPMPAEKQPKSRFSNFILREFTANDKLDLLQEWNMACCADAATYERAEKAPQKRRREKVAAPRIRRIQAEDTQPAAESQPAAETAAVKEAARNIQAHSDDDGLECLVRNVLRGEDLDECMHLKAMLTDLDYKEGHRFDSVVRMLISGMEKIRNEKRKDKKAETMNVNISGGNVNNVGSTITNQQNERRHEK